MQSERFSGGIVSCFVGAFGGGVSMCWCGWIVPQRLGSWFNCSGWFGGMEFVRQISDSCWSSWWTRQLLCGLWFDGGGSALRVGLGLGSGGRGFEGKDKGVNVEDEVVTDCLEGGLAGVGFGVLVEGVLVEADVVQHADVCLTFKGLAESGVGGVAGFREEGCGGEGCTDETVNRVDVG